LSQRTACNKRGYAQNNQQSRYLYYFLHYFFDDKAKDSPRGAVNQYNGTNSGRKQAPGPVSKARSITPCQ